MPRHLCFLIKFLVFLFCGTTFAQLPVNFKFEHLTVKDGLSSTNVNSIYQDKYGFLWLGTEGGLDRYDGYKINEFVHQVNKKNSLSQNYIISVAETEDGDLWIASGFRGIHKFFRDNLSFKRFKHKSEDENSLGGDIVTSLCLDHSDALWIGSHLNGGLSRLLTSTNTMGQTVYTFNRFKHDPKNANTISNSSVLSIFEDKDSQLWIGTKNGLNRLNTDNLTFKRYLYNKKHLLGVSAIFADNNGNIWVGTISSGIYQLAKGQGTFKRILHKITGSISSFVQDQRGFIWIGLNNGGGLYIFDPSNEELIHLIHQSNNPYSLSDNTINCLFVDKSGIVWIGTSNMGLNKFDWKKQRFLHLFKNPHSDFSLSDESVLSIFEDSEEKVWVGTKRSGVDIFNFKTRTKTNYKIYKTTEQLAEYQNTKAICKDRRGNVWCGTINGLGVFDASLNKILLYENYLINSGNKKFTSFPVRTLFVDKYDHIWIGTEGFGLCVFRSNLPPIPVQACHFVSPNNPR